MSDNYTESQVNRIKALRERREAMLAAKIPNALELNRQEVRMMQTGLF